MKPLQIKTLPEVKKYVVSTQLDADQVARIYAEKALQERNKLGVKEKLSEDEAKKIAESGMEGLLQGVNITLTGKQGADVLSSMKDVYAQALATNMTGYDQAQFAKNLANTPGTMDAFTSVASTVNRTWQNFTMPTIQSSIRTNLEDLLNQTTTEAGKYGFTFAKSPKEMSEEEKLQAVIATATGQLSEQYANQSGLFKYKPIETK